jgi:hypothetical protein
MRTTVASTRIATASPSPICLVETFGAITMDRNTATMMAAAAVITRAVRDSPRATAAALSPEESYSSRTRESRNTS